MKATALTKKLGALVLCGTLLAGALTIPAAALSRVNAQISPYLTILVDGTERTFYNVNGQEVQPILYGGTTYLPVRAIGELMGKNVDWNESTRTVTLAGTRTTAAVTGTPDTAARTASVTAEIRDDFTIIVDGQTRTFYDAAGNRVYPLLYGGSTYLPLRAIGELMGKTVSWDGATSTASLTGGTLVTDADSFSGGSGGTGTSTNLIGVEAAKAKALVHAGLTSSQVTFVQAELDRDDGRTVYDIEFYTSDYREYDYEIDAYTGAVLSYDYDADFYAPPSSSGTFIGEASAKAKALAHAGLTSSQVTFVQAKLDRDDGRTVYDIEFYTSDYKEYDYEIDAYTGAVLSYDYDADFYTPPTSSGSYIGLDRAKEIALAKVSGATSANIRRAYQDRDDGRVTYEIEIRYNLRDYEFEIDASTGAILDWDSESIYD